MMWLHSAPAEDIMVVSEMGEQWSPQTAPARHADMLMIRMGSSAPNMYVTIGIRIPNVPQEVPVANASTQATKKIMAGRKRLRPAAALFIRSATKYLALYRRKLEV